MNQALIAAVDRNDAAGVRRLLHQGADPNAQILTDDERPMWKRVWDMLQHRSVSTVAIHQSVLMHAIDSVSDGGNDDNADTVLLLLEAGAHVNDRAAGSLDQQRIGFFFGRGKQYWPQTTPLIEAAYCREWKTIQVLMAYHADVTAADDYGDTALMYAATEQAVEVVEALIQRGASVNVRDALGETALFWAFGEQRADGARVNICSSWDRDHSATIELDYASVAPRLRATVGCLLRHGASVKDNHGRGDTILSLVRLVTLPAHDERLIQMLKQSGAK